MFVVLGQQLVKLPGGRFQVITPKRTVQQAPAATPGGGGVRPALQPGRAAVGGGRVQAVRMQTSAGGVIMSNAVSPSSTEQQSVPAVQVRNMIWLSRPSRADT